MKRHLLFVLVVLGAMLAGQARADLFVIANSANQTRHLTASEVAAFYLGKSRSFPGGDYAFVLDYPQGSPLRERFFQKVAGMSLSQVNAYWSRLMFSGQEIPPQAAPSEQVVLDAVRRNQGALGYVSVLPRDAGVRVLMTIKE